MAISKEKREKMEALIYKFFDAMDPTGTNTTKYRLLFQSMDDRKFDSYFKSLFASEIDYLTLDIVDYERDLKMEQVEAGAKVLGIPLYEKVALPYANMDKNNPTITKYAVPVGYVHIKRVQQLRSKKNTTSIETSERSATTGQVTGHDKNSRENDTEVFALVTLGADATLKEFLGPKADDLVMKAEMANQISTNGYVDLDKLTSKVENKTTLNTLDTYLICMGLKSDLVTDGLVLKKTLND